MATNPIIVVSAVVGPIIVIRCFKDRPISRYRAAREVLELSSKAQDLRYYRATSHETT